MPSLRKIQTLIIESATHDWHRPALGPFYANAYDIDDDVFRLHSELLVYRGDVRLTIQHGLKWGHLSRHIETATQLWDGAHFPDESVQLFFGDVFWNGALIDRVQLISVDGARAVLPVGTRDALNASELEADRRDVKVEWEYSANPFETAIARIVNDDDADFRRYFERAGLVLKD